MLDNQETQEGFGSIRFDSNFNLVRRDCFVSIPIHVGSGSDQFVSVSSSKEIGSIPIRVSLIPVRAVPVRAVPVFNRFWFTIGSGSSGSGLHGF